MDFKYYQEEYKKYMKSQDGGAESGEESSENNNNSQDRRGRGRGNYIFQIKSIDIKQDGPEHKFKGVITKTPPIKIRFHESEISWVKIINAVMKFVNRNLANFKKIIQQKEDN